MFKVKDGGGRQMGRVVGVWRSSRLIQRVALSRPGRGWTMNRRPSIDVECWPSMQESRQTQVDKTLLSALIVFTARRYASAVYAMALCLCLSVCLCLSEVGVLLKWLNGLSGFLTWRLPSTYPTLCYKEIVLTPKIRVLPSGTLSKMLDLEIFITAAGRAECRQ